MRGEKKMGRKVVLPPEGSPPHARGKEEDESHGSHTERITPACAGKRHGAELRQQLVEDHPRMRGEKPSGPCPGTCGMGSPPHARGKDLHIRIEAVILGITPACAGKSLKSMCGLSKARDHPRMRGEKLYFAPLVFGTLGSPPHARGKALHRARKAAPLRITPACAGKSRITAATLTAMRDHPRMRVEKGINASVNRVDAGSPPHARGKGRTRRCYQWAIGITPACAGKSRYGSGRSNERQDHPRMRGEKCVSGSARGSSRGSPPHARGKDNPVNMPSVFPRITPACAGKSSCMDPSWKFPRDHPRMRGEKIFNAPLASIGVGSPPHARGKVLAFHAINVVNGITPACAGKSITGNRFHTISKDHPRMRGEKLPIIC